MALTVPIEPSLLVSSLLYSTPGLSVDGELTDTQRYRVIRDNPQPWHPHDWSTSIHPSQAVEHLENTKNTEDARLERAVKQREAKEDASLKAKAARRAQEAIAIDKSRQHQLARKRELAEAEKVADRTMAQEWIENHKKLVAKERQKEQLISKRNRNNAASLKKVSKLSRCS